jgi:nucleoside-diphosphate-sugar epimerase
VELSGASVLITGGAGLVGSHIADQCVKEGVARVVVLDDLSRGRRENLQWAMAHGPVDIIEGDIRNQAVVRTAVAGADVVFHQAAIRITQCAAEPRLALEVLVDGAYNVFEACAEAGVKKVVAASSASVYGLAESFPTPEDHHTYNNRTIYGAAKSFNEAMLRSLHEMLGLDYVALRYFNVYGPRMDVHGAYTEVLVRWMERVNAGKPPVIFGDGSQTMDFIHVADIARANILAARADLTDEVFNVGSGAETSLNELAGQLLRVMGSQLSVEYGPERKANPVPRRLADVRRADERLNFAAKVDLDEGLTGLVRWWRETALA